MDKISRSEWALAVIIIICVSIVIYWSYESQSWQFSATKDIAIFFTTCFFSYRFAKISLEENSKSQIKDLGIATIRRIRILYNDLQSLVDTIGKFNNDDPITRERYESVKNTLLMLQNAVKASFDEIKQTAQLPIDDSDLYDIQILLTKEQKYPNNIRCPACKHENTTELANHNGASKVVECDNCSQRFNVHRRYDGILFVGGGARDSRLSGQASFVCPNPACEEEISIKFGVNQKFVTRTCHVCHQGLKYSTMDEVVSESKTSVEKISKDEIIFSDNSSGYHCPGCDIFLKYNEANQDVSGNVNLQCYKCGSLVVVEHV